MSSESVLRELGVHKIINGYGPATILGGSVLAGQVTRAMEQVSHCFLDMDELLDVVNSKIAQLLGVEAAHVTSGAASGLALCAAACMTGLDQSKIERLPDTGGFEKNEIIIQTGHENTYDRCLRISGAKVVPIGIPYLTYPWQLRNAISDRTAAISHFTIGTARPGLLELEDVISIARDASIPVIVDGCNDVLPDLHNISGYFSKGVDLLVLSGGKTIQGPNDTGVICGRKDLVEACRANSYPHMNGIGRAMKVSKEQIVGLFVALEVYSKTDPQERYNSWVRKLDVIERELGGVPNIRVKRIPGQPSLKAVPTLEIELDEGSIGSTAQEIVSALKAYDPPIVLDIDYWKNFAREKLFVNPICLQESEESILAGALRNVLTDGALLRKLLSTKSRLKATAYP